MRCMIYVCHHAAPAHVLRTPLFSTLVSGVRPRPGEAFDTDLDGENIAEMLEHSEMRQQYYVWKNTLLAYDYVGFEHYRRLFFLDPVAPGDAPVPFVEDARAKFLSDQNLPRLVVDDAQFLAYLNMRRQMSFAAAGSLTAWIASHDIIVQRPLFEMELEAQWKTTHMADMWDVLVESILTNSYFDKRPARIDFSMRNPHFCNMYIMKAGLFDEYMKFWWQSISYVAARVEIYPRLLGHFAERIFNAFLMQKRMEQPLLRVGVLPHLFLDQQTL